MERLRVSSGALKRTYSDVKFINFPGVTFTSCSKVSAWHEPLVHPSVDFYVQNELKPTYMHLSVQITPGSPRGG